MTVVRRGATGVVEFYGLSGDTKPTLSVTQAGSIFYESDTGVVYRWSGSVWFVAGVGAGYILQNGLLVSSANPLLTDGGSPVLATAADAITATSFRITALTNVAQAIKASLGTIYSLEPYNSHTAVVFLQFYDVAAGAVLVGTTPPKKTIAIPTGAGGDMPRIYPIGFGVAISVACTSTYTGGTAPGAALQLSGEFA